MSYCRRRRRQQPKSSWVSDQDNDVQQIHPVQVEDSGQQACTLSEMRPNLESTSLQLENTNKRRAFRKNPDESQTSLVAADATELRGPWRFLKYQLLPARQSTPVPSSGSSSTGRTVSVEEPRARLVSASTSSVASSAAAVSTSDQQRRDEKRKTSGLQRSMEPVVDDDNFAPSASVRMRTWTSAAALESFDVAGDDNPNDLTKVVLEEEVPVVAMETSKNLNPEEAIVGNHKEEDDKRTKHLTNWIPAIMGDCDDYELVVEGNLLDFQSGNLTGKWWRSTKVLDRRHSRLLSSQGGGFCVLEGLLNVLHARRRSVPEFIISKFKLGLPNNWMMLVSMWVVWDKGQKKLRSYFDDEDSHYSPAPVPISLLTSISSRSESNSPMMNQDEHSNKTSTAIASGTTADNCLQDVTKSIVDLNMKGSGRWGGEDHDVSDADLMEPVVKRPKTRSATSSAKRISYVERKTAGLKT